MGLRGKAGDVADFDQQPGRGLRPDAVQVPSAWFRLLQQQPVQLGDPSECSCFCQRWCGSVLSRSYLMVFIVKCDCSFAMPGSVASCWVMKCSYVGRSGTAMRAW